MFFCALGSIMSLLHLEHIDSISLMSRQGVFHMKQLHNIIQQLHAVMGIAIFHDVVPFVKVS